jgi:hypothetical protein
VWREITWAVNFADEIVGLFGWRVLGMIGDSLLELVDLTVEGGELQLVLGELE